MEHIFHGMQQVIEDGKAEYYNHHHHLTNHHPNVMGAAYDALGSDWFRITFLCIVGVAAFLGMTISYFALEAFIDLASPEN